jgi:hypothetical protein
VDQSTDSCAVCAAPGELLELQHGNRRDRFCGWTCLMVFGAGKERDLRLYLVSLAEQHSSQLRTALTRLAAADAESSPLDVLDALDEILQAIRAGA